MNTTPPELHSYICSLACSDDGYTARSLSLVSRYFSQITLPFRYQSICVTKPPQAHYLSKRLEMTPSHLRRIRHLFISDDGYGGRELINAIITILTFAASTLETLTVVVTSPLTSTSFIARVLRMHYPHLYELTVSGHYPFPSTTGCFPSLECLHLLGNRNPHGLLSLGGLASAMPSLTHLRVSGLALAVSFSQQLEQAFTSSLTHDDDKSMFPAKLPPNLCQLSIQCGPELSSAKPNTNACAKDGSMVEILGGLEERVKKESHQTRFSLLSRSTRELSVDELHKHWVARLRGYTGCWSLT